MYSTGAPASAGAPVASGAPVAVATVPQMQIPAQVGANQGGVSFRRAFAGHGKLIRHQSWLLDGASSHASSVRNAVAELMRRRGILGTSITPQRLTERGVMMEVRDYVQIQRGVSTVFTYVAPAGQDLYISRATTVLPAVSRFRVFVLIFLVFVLLVGLASGASSASNLSSGYGLVAAPSLPQLLAIGLTPLIVFFFIMFFIFSFVNWLVEKDFWVYLRPRSLNDFQLDDIALLEHATDGIVTDAVKQDGLDATKITPPPEGYQQKKKIRAV